MSLFFEFLNCLVWKGLFLCIFCISIIPECRLNVYISIIYIIFIFLAVCVKIFIEVEYVIKIPDYCKFIFEKLENSGFECYAVGGCVRDSIMGFEPDDWDFSTNAKPENICDIFSSYKLIEIGKKFGTICVVSENRTFEITTFRNDGAYTDNRHPDEVLFCNNIQDDLSRRDFTVNSIAYSEKTGIIDPFGGIGDIEKRIIRCTGEPIKRFSEDALRIFRAIRFSSVLGFDVEKETYDAIFTLKENLLSVHPHRIKKELIKFLCGKNVSSALLNYKEVLAVVIPEIKPMFNCEQNNPHHIYDVWTHTAKTFDFAPNDSIIRLSLLFHDSGKPIMKTTDEKGIDHFIMHPRKSKEIAYNVLSRFGFSNSVISDVSLLVRYHDERFRKKSESVKNVLRELGEDLFYKLLILSYCDVSAQSDLKRSEKFGLLEYARKEADKIISENQCYSLSQLAVKGNDLIDLGYKGKSVGKILNELLKAVIKGKIDNNKNSLINYVFSGEITLSDD